MSERDSNPLQCFYKGCIQSNQQLALSRLMHSIHCGYAIFPYQALEGRPAQETFMGCAGHITKNSKALNIHPNTREQFKLPVLWLYGTRRTSRPVTYAHSEESILQICVLHWNTPFQLRGHCLSADKRRPLNTYAYSTQTSLSHLTTDCIENMRAEVAFRYRLNPSNKLIFLVFCQVPCCKELIPLPLLVTLPFTPFILLLVWF
jgi:hypothetical protein